MEHIPLEETFSTCSKISSIYSDQLELLSKCSSSNDDGNIAKTTTAYDVDITDLLSSILEQVTDQLHEVRKEIHIKSSKWTSLTKNRVRMQKRRLETQRRYIQEQLANQYASFCGHITKDAYTVRLLDKISFVVGVSNACVSPVIVSRLPQWIPIFYTVQFFFFITLRYINYKSRQSHYFFFDLCYYVNLLTLLYIWVFPSSTVLYTAVFTLTNGPIAFAITVWRNSLVFHSLDKVTSVFIHIYPPVVSYTLRWLPELDKNTEAAIRYRTEHFSAVQNMPTLSFQSYLCISTSFYLAWQLFYFFIVIIKHGKKVDSGERRTSYSTLLKPSPKRRSFIQFLAGVFGEKHKLYGLMMWQFWYNMGTCLLTYFFYKSFWLHSIFLVSMFAVSVWNGANYYIEVFSKSYLDEVEYRQKQFKSS
ncbi:hypothetical protein K501DRAFT_244912 [Backusella circina FSU 941]|nr:hypothetical protein K501DRAFT_244912 [Backusella circina FSU 941]